MGHGLTEDARGPLLLGCSPRAGGNTDTALDIVGDALGRAAGRPTRMFLRDHTVLPCAACGYCASHKGQCPLQNRDTSAVLFDALQTASLLVLAVPVYFYHVPAQLKALIDRSQPWWMLRDVWKEKVPADRFAHVILVGARPRGTRLFEGSMLTLRYWLELFGFELAAPLTLYGLDGPDALRNDEARRQTVGRYAATVRDCTR